jgi:hypothetical protein
VPNWSREDSAREQQQFVSTVSPTSNLQEGPIMFGIFGSKISQKGTVRLNHIDIILLHSRFNSDFQKEFECVPGGTDFARHCMYTKTHQHPAIIDDRPEDSGVVMGKPCPTPSPRKYQGT